MKAALHPQERQRLAALARYHILDTAPEPEFDDIAELVAAICETPIAVVNLIARGRQFFKAEVGLGVREMPLEPSICAHAILRDELMVIPDTRRDPRFVDNPLVTGDPPLRFYAGALLKSSEGLPLGTLCVLDHVPRQLSAGQLKSLQTLAQHVMHLLDMRLARQREAQLKHTLEESLAMHKAMINTVSHDLRTPVNTVLLSAACLAQRSDDAELRDIAGRLRRMSEQMTGLIDDLQDHEALQSGRLSLEFTAVDPRRLLTDVHDALSLTAKQARLELEVTGPPSLPPVRADEQRCAQMLTNLVQNAIKFTPPGGRVTIRAEQHDGQVRFAVADTGVGIEPDDLDKLFRPHWRADTAAEQPGTGLGLSIVRMLARAHGGDVDVESARGSGSCFSFGLPLAAEDGLASAVG